ncbi:MAG: thermonuclease family protein [Nitrospirota bacterium]|nr:thermonuclease family protein [Nitrospirota bacterium]
MFTYKATLVYVVDGDTVDVNVDLGFQITQTMRLRFNGINTPELRGEERAEGLKAKAFVEEELGKAKTIGIKTYKIESFGRYVADVFYSSNEIPMEDVFTTGVCLNRRLVEEGLAQEVQYRSLAGASA